MMNHWPFFKGFSLVCFQIIPTNSFINIFLMDDFLALRVKNFISSGLVNSEVNYF